MNFVFGSSFLSLGWLGFAPPVIMISFYDCLFFYFNFILRFGVYYFDFIFFILILTRWCTISIVYIVEDYAVSGAPNIGGFFLFLFFVTFSNVLYNFIGQHN